MNSTHPNELKEKNPSVRIWCKYKVLLDSLIVSILEVNKKKDKEALRIFLELYIGYRDKYGCKGCQEGKEICPHYTTK